MKANTYGEHLYQFTQAVDHVTEDTFRHVLDLVATYANQELGFRYFELMKPQVVNGKDGLATEVNYRDGRRLSRGYQYAITIFNHEQTNKPLTQSAVAYATKQPLWIVAKTKLLLGDCADGCEDKWSSQDLPPYKRVHVLDAKTSVIIPVVHGTDVLGVVDLEGESYTRCSASMKKELALVVTCLARVWFLFQAFQVQDTGTANALDNLNDILANRDYSPLGPPKLFLAYSEGAKLDVLNIIRTTLSKREFEECIETIDWKYLHKPGPILKELLDHIDRCRFGICYLSEASPEKANQFRDNPNVLFEAGMFHALANLSAGHCSNWIPIREEGSPPAPFDFSTEKTIIIKRDSKGEITESEKQDISNELYDMLKSLLDTV